jgi:hypothetical protein
MIRTLCLLVLCLFLCAFKGCDDERKPVDPPPAPAPASVKENESDAAKAAKLAAAIDAEKNEAARLKLEIELLRLQKSIADKASKDAENRIELKQKELEAVKLEALQTKLYIGAGVLALITAVLVALAVYFKSAHMIYWACGSGGIACLVAFAGFLTPYVYWIAGGGMIALVGFVCWLLFGRDKALFQLTKGMNDIKAHVPQYKGILREHIDSAQDKIIDATRKRWHDPQV